MCPMSFAVCSYRKWPDEAGDESGTVEKLLAVFFSLALAIGVVATPFALLHLS